MTSEHIKIIATLLNDSYISSSQQSKLLSLAAKKMGGDINQLNERINKLESRIYGAIDSEGNTSSKTMTKNGTDSPTIYNNPKHTHSFLVEFNQDHVLRHTCHEIGAEELRDINEQILKKENYCYYSHTQEIEQAWNKLKKQKAPMRLKAMITAYLTGKDKWSSDEIETSWGYNEFLRGNTAVRKWCANHPGLPPNANRALLHKENATPLHLDKPFTWGDNPIQNFTDLVLNFKNRLHIRNDSSLSALLTTWNNKLGQEEDIQVKLSQGFGGKIEIFTHVDQLLNGYKALLLTYRDNWKIEFKDKAMPAIEVSVTENQNKVLLSITQNTTYRKSIDSTVTRPRGADYTRIISRNLNGNCDLKLRALFPNKKKYIVDLWTPLSNFQHNKNRAPQTPIEADQTPEVTHILEFPKS